MKKKITIAYSQDTDDAFMVYALKSGHLSSEEFDFEFISKDIQELNDSARKEIYDITAISIAAYPDISENYYMMPIGASIGDGFGPIVVGLEGSPIKTFSDLNGCKVAVPGLKTSAFFALSLLSEGFEPVPMPFHEIEGAVTTGQVDAGVLIHERQLNYSEHGLKKLLDLGEEWRRRYRLPLPLGANAIRRKLGVEAVATLTTIYRQSILWALEHRSLALKEASQQAFSPLVDQTMADRYISRYVNQRSLSMQPDVIDAMDLLFSSGAKNGLCQPLGTSSSYICAES